MSEPRIDLVIFDCDGVLIDSESIANEVCARHLMTLGPTLTMHEFAARYCGSPIRDIWRRVEADFGVIVDDAMRAAIDTEIHALFETSLRTVSGVVEMLDCLAAKRCVASSTGIVKLRANLARVGLLDRFEPGVFSASQVARGKPAPDVFLFAASQMGADPSRCIVVEDSVAGVTAARRAGMVSIGFAGGGHIDDGHPDRLKAVGAKVIAETMHDLGRLLGEMA